MFEDDCKDKEALMGKFKKQSNGLYRAGVTIGYDDKGNLKRKWLSARTITELEKKIMETKISIGSGMNLLDNDVRFGDYARMWLETYKTNRGLNTRQMYEHLIRKQFEPIAGLKVKDIKSMHLQAIINENSDLARTCEHNLLQTVPNLARLDTHMPANIRQLAGCSISDLVFGQNSAGDLVLQILIGGQGIKENRQHRVLIIF